MGVPVGGWRKPPAWAGLMVAVSAACLVLEGSVAAAATRHVVGGSTTGWGIPPNASFYSTWAASQTFMVGDTLVFNFPTGIHNVIKVPKGGYDACSAANQIGSTLTTGPATVAIASPGNHYFICGVTGHCAAGQKLAISIASSRTSSPAPSPAASGPSMPMSPGTLAIPPGSAGASSPVAPGPSGSSGGGSTSASSLPSDLSFAKLLLTVVSIFLLR